VRAAGGSITAVEIVLASASPRRRELLALAGVPHRVQPSAIDERRAPGETPAGFAERAAQDKARAVAQGCPAGTWVLGADTVVVADDEVLGKPRDRRDGQRMLRLLSGRTHRVITGVALVAAPSGRSESFAAETAVTFRPLAEGWIEGYLDSGEPMDKAGAYGIQGLGGLLVAGIQGSYTNVVGLPLGETVLLLERAGLFAAFSRAGGAT